MTRVPIRVGFDFGSDCLLMRESRLQGINFLRSPLT